MGLATVTVLFCDLVGSTALNARLGDDAGDALRRSCFEAWGLAIESHRGRVVKNQGDGVMVAFASTADAIGAAIALQHATAAVDTVSGRPGLELRVGVSVGEAADEDGDLFGTPVTEAARLCAAASGGQILVSDLARALVGSRGGHAFASMGALELKGLPDPVAASEVRWERETHETNVPLPPALAAHAALPFVGRDDELAQLLGAWERVRGGGRELIFVSGEPGIGKTRLVAELAQRATPDGVVCYGRCPEDYATPMQPMADALSRLVTTAPPEFVADICSEIALAGELSRVIPVLPSIVPSLTPPLSAEPDTERYRLFEAVAEFFSALSQRVPVLFVVDDLHWAPRLHVLLHLMRSPMAMRLLCVGTYRDTELGRTHPLAEALAELRTDPGYERIALRGLPAAAVGVLLAATAPGADSDEMAQRVYEETDGNPFFVGEVLQHLAETGSLDVDTIPEGVRQVIGQRVSRLGGSADEVLSVAAVIGAEFDVVVVTEAGGFDDEDVLTVISEAERARLVVATDRPGRYAFAHALVRSTLYSELVTAQRLRLHRRVARALEARGDNRLAELAYHYGESVALGDIDLAVSYARRAGDAARETLAFEQAAAHYQQALTAFDLHERPDPGARADLLILLGEAWRRTGDDRFKTVLDEASRIAHDLDDGVRLAHVALASNPTGLASATGEVETETVGALEEALATLGDTDARLRARLLASLASELLWDLDHERRTAISLEAISLARAAGDPGTLAYVLVSIHDACSTPWNLAERVGIDRELIALGGAGNLEAEFAGRRYMFEEAIEQALDASWRDHLAAAGDVAARLRQPYAVYSAAMMRASGALLDGDFATAHRLIDSGLEQGERAHVPDSVRGSVWGGQTFVLARELGGLADIEPFVALSPPAFETAHPYVLAELGRAEEGRPMFDRYAARGFPVQPNFVWYLNACALARVAVALNEREAAAHFFELLEPYRGRIAWFGIATLGPVDAFLAPLAAALGRSDASELCESALATAERVDSPPMIARACVELAEWGGGREPALRALDIATKLGMTEVEQRARRALA